MKMKVSEFLVIGMNLCSLGVIFFVIYLMASTAINMKMTKKTNHARVALNNLVMCDTRIGRENCSELFSEFYTRNREREEFGESMLYKFFTATSTYKDEMRPEKS